MVNSNTVSTIKIFLNSTTLAFPFLSYLNANSFSSLMAVNIFFKIFIMCILIISHVILGVLSLKLSLAHFGESCV